MTQNSPDSRKTPPEWARRLPNLAHPQLGCEVIAASDDFFGDKNRLISPLEPVFKPGVFDDHGKWMDGWETRRRRDGGTDWCIVRLGQEVEMTGVNFDTSHFTGNYPHACALEGSCDAADTPHEKLQWQPLISQTPLAADSHCYLQTPPARARWLRLTLYPDGGMARLRVFGRAVLTVCGGEVDLASVMNGCRVVAESNCHYGKPEYMLMPGKGVNMEDGWETRRLREPGHDWAELALGAAGIVRRVVVDTSFFKGNYPPFFSIDATYAPDLHDAACVAASMFWKPLMEKTPLGPDAVHEFTDGIVMQTPITHVRLNMFPDGGISRFRLFGTVAGGQ